MDIFIYADESGVFDRDHEEHFVFGGLILLGGEELGDAYHLYNAVENRMRQALELGDTTELKATLISPKTKGDVSVYS